LATTQTLAEAGHIQKARNVDHFHKESNGPCLPPELPIANESCNTVTPSNVDVVIASDKNVQVENAVLQPSDDVGKKTRSPTRVFKYSEKVSIT